MSVAFRRESDEEHLEPRFELPIPPGPNLVTPRGLRLIQARVAELEAVPAGQDEDARKDRERTLRYWRQRLATAQLAPAASGEEVAFGTRVTIRQGKRKRSLDIVGHDEAEPAAGRIAFTAPLAQALMGAEEGEEIALEQGAATIERIQVLPG